MTLSVAGQKYETLPCALQGGFLRQSRCGFQRAMDWNYVKSFIIEGISKGRWKRTYRA
jgi:hypothetical protein